MSRTQTLLVIGGKLAVWLCHDLKQRLSISGFKHWQWPWDILSQSSRLLQQMQTAARNATRENPNMHKLRTRKHTAIWREKTLDYAPAWKLAPIRSSRSFAWHFAVALPFKDHKILPQNSKVSLWTSRLFIFNSCSLIFFHSIVHVFSVRLCRCEVSQFCEVKLPEIEKPNNLHEWAILRLQEIHRFLVWTARRCGKTPKCNLTSDPTYSHNFNQFPIQCEMSNSTHFLFPFTKWR